MSWLVNSWYKKSVVRYVLAPLSAIYRLAVTLNRKLYDWNLKRTFKFDIPVIVVGNLTVGGTGKTPFVIWLVENLKKEGFKPGVVSRGYGSGITEPTIIDLKQHTAFSVGDEPFLIAERTGVAVAVCPKRSQAVAKLMYDTDCDCIIADDGLQHYALARNIEILMIDGQRRFGNGYCLPAGPLREPLYRVNSFDLKVVKGVAKSGEFSMTLKSGSLLPVGKNSSALAPKPGQKIHAVSGLASPKSFFDSLVGKGFDVIIHEFPDHHPFCLNDFNFNDNLPIIMTEKDAVKCRVFADDRFWFLPINANVSQKILDLIINDTGLII